MFNRVMLIGNLGADPDIKFSGNGTAIANMRLAVNDNRKDASGQTIQNTYWFTAVAFGKTAEVISSYCSKGSKVGIDGKLIQREWEDNSGQKRSSVEIRVDHIELLSGQNNGQSQGQGQGQGQQANRQQPPPQNRPQGQQGGYGAPPPPPRGSTQGGYKPPPDDDIPF